eukprot:CAMPEP_0204329942 /NCGR_PEP_ID=MMETSP0469-20131031/14536_1 /ASSEMBLY_ACC=CAM_ASM_000384 /TAXON_ID=2969 /ORGANISM="Oxyrrhis marina" /LENGTH=393 /DNA_ID=CAMNT_0051312639 /DNA_START=5 /DNA_END=1186 /DNA_ORIENTATION=+
MTAAWTTTWEPQTPSADLPTKNTFIDFGADSDSDSEEHFSWSWPSVKRQPQPAPAARPKGATAPQARRGAPSATTGTPAETDDEEGAARAVDSDDDPGAGVASEPGSSDSGAGRAHVRFEEEDDEEDSSSDEESEDEYVSQCRLGLLPLPSAGSAGHFDGTCRRCCFHPKGRCENGADCGFCHFDHEKRRRSSKKKNKKSRRRRSRAAARATREAEMASMVSPAAEQAVAGRYAVRVPTVEQELAELQRMLALRDAVLVEHLQMQNQQGQMQLAALMSAQQGMMLPSPCASVTAGSCSPPTMGSGPSSPCSPHAAPTSGSPLPCAPPVTGPPLGAAQMAGDVVGGGDAGEATAPPAAMGCEAVAAPVAGPALAWVLLPTGQVVQVIVAPGPQV